ncbi:MAG: carbohydrate ABC transporter permease [Oscillospiraceae bacterium]|nr:carbohydrate ABC transporter permease [Oscillospiraceae bacterium]
MVESYKASQKIATVIKYIVLIIVGIIMIYPLLWMIGATFMSNAEIYGSISPIPMNWDFSGWAKAATTTLGGSINIWQAMINTYLIVIPKVIFTIISSTIVAYGFGRFEFVGKKVFFAIMVSTLFLPQVVMNVPQFIMYNSWGWVNSPLYLPLIASTLFATESYFVFMLVQFLRSVPRELDEAAKIDGCNAFQILVIIICPMLKPAMVSAGLFQFMWSSNDFLGPLLYVTSPERYPAAIFVRSAVGDSGATVEWNLVLALSLISILPSLIVFFLAQRQFVEGISAGSVKG